MFRETVYEIFGIKGFEPYLEKYNPNFKVREEQNKLVYDVLNSFSSGKKHILMEAPTGTGKTFVYTYISLIEYIIKMVNYSNKLEEENNDDLKKFDKVLNKNRIVIVTNNKSLQKQVYEDMLNVIIPSLDSYFEYKGLDKHKDMLKKLNVGIYKSKSNYLCKKSFDNDKNKDENFKLGIKKEMEIQGTPSIDYDLVDRYDNNGKLKYDNKLFDKYNAKDRNCKNCKIKECKFNKSKKEIHNIMITNYDYLLLLSKKVNLEYIHTLILDEVHNLPNKLINISSDEFSLDNFLFRLPKIKSKLNNEFILHLGKLLNYFKGFKTDKPKFSDTELFNLTYGISQNEKNIENYVNKKLNIDRTKMILSIERNKVIEYLKNIYFKDLDKLILEYEDKFFDNLDNIFENIRKDSKDYMNKGIILSDYDKFIQFKEVNGMSDYIKNKKGEITTNLTDNNIEELDKIFSSNSEIKSLYEECKNLVYSLNNLDIYSRIINEMKSYIFYLKDLISKLNDSSFEVTKRLVPDVITVSVDINLKVNLYLMNDDTVNAYNKFLDTINKVKHIIYCSATMSIEGDYSFFVSRLGLLESETYRCYIPNSPFDKYNKRYIFLDKNYCLDKYGKETKYKWLLDKKLDSIITKGDSGSLILCTNKVDVDNAYNCLKDNLIDNKYSIHSQYYSSLPTIMQDMNKNIDNDTIVIGNTGFWEGIDFKGDNMTTLIITKLPYMRVNEPSIISKFNRLLFDKIEYDKDNSFISDYWDFYNNMMKIVFYQGVGRLIRSVTDYGVIVCLFSYDNFIKKFNIITDKHLGIDDGIVLEAFDLNILENLIKSSIKTTKQNREKYLK